MREAARGPTGGLANRPRNREGGLMGSQNGGGRRKRTILTPKEEQIAQMLATGATIKSIAGVVGLSESHAYRKNHDPLIKARVDEIRRQLVDRTIGKLVKSAAKAVLTLVKLLDPPASDAVRVSAAKAILQE